MQDKYHDKAIVYIFKKVVEVNCMNQDINLVNHSLLSKEFISCCSEHVFEHWILVRSKLESFFINRLDSSGNYIII